jgi:superfamily I DNA/RNA helicase
MKQFVARKEVILMQDNQNEILKEFDNFCIKVVKRWQKKKNYNFIDDIELSDRQSNVVDFHAKHMLIRGSAGSGKSCVLLYKMVNCLQNETEPQKILYLTYNDVLIKDTRLRSKRIEGIDELSKKHDVKIKTFHEFAYQELKKTIGLKAKRPSIKLSCLENMKGSSLRKVIKAKNDTIANSGEELYKTHKESFIRDEIMWMKANGYINRKDYLDCERSGRGSTPRLTKAQRNTIYQIYEKYENFKREAFRNNYLDFEDYALEILENINEYRDEFTYDYIFVDEVQDFDAMQLKALRKMCRKSLVMAGDSKQQIYKNRPHSFKNLGIDIVNSRKDLTENFRSTDQIMSLANSLDISSEEKDSARIKYQNQGDLPRLVHGKNETEVKKYLEKRIKEIHSKDPNKVVAVIHRDKINSKDNNDTGFRAFLRSKFSIADIEHYKQKDNKMVFYADPYNVKGLEFDVVFIVHFDSLHYPLESKMAKFEDVEIADRGSEYEKDKKEAIEDEKKLLYVAMSRAKEELELVYSGDEISSFCDDFGRGMYERIELGSV